MSTHRTTATASQRNQQESHTQEGNITVILKDEQVKEVTEVQFLRSSL